MIAVIDYGMGNLQSVRHALEMVGANVQVTREESVVREAERIILPGVGAFGQCMHNLRATGLVRVLEEEVLDHRKPFLGICVGMQALARLGHERGTHEGLGWIGGEVKRLDGERLGVQVPHVGWNDVEPAAHVPLLQGLGRDRSFYFTHSYHFVPDDAGRVAATTDYGERFAAALCHQNIFAIQFHPEKSQENGLTLLENFLKWEPS